MGEMNFLGSNKSLVIWEICLWAFAPIIYTLTTFSLYMFAHLLNKRGKLCKNLSYLPGQGRKNIRASFRLCSSRLVLRKAAGDVHKIYVKVELPLWRLLYHLNWSIYLIQKGISDFIFKICPYVLLLSILKWSINEVCFQTCDPHLIKWSLWNHNPLLRPPTRWMDDFASVFLKTLYIMQLLY